jgi:hypothetical protein
MDGKTVIRGWVRADLPEVVGVSEQQTPRLLDQLSPPCCLYCGLQITEADTQCHALDEGVCDT